MGVWSNKEKNKYLKGEEMREMSVEWRMGKGRKSPPTMDGRLRLAGCFSSDGDGRRNKEMKCKKKK